MIVNDKFKSYSLWTEEEHAADIEREIANLSEEELQALYLALVESEYEQEIVGLEYDRPMVPIYEWVNDPYFLGDISRSIYEPWKEDIIEMFSSDSYNTGVFVGGIGSGKSTISHICILRMIYEASCLRNPAVTYGLAPGSTIAFCNLAKSKETARRVVFDGIAGKLQEIPYFKYDFPAEIYKNEIRFPKKLEIIAGSSTDTSIIGANIFGGIIDEGNFWRTGQKGNTKKATTIFDAVNRRIKSRYMRRGRVPGMLIVVSSKTSKKSFTDTLVNNAIKAGDKTVFVRDRNIIEVKRDLFSDKVFRVLVGDENWPSKILASDEDEGKYKGSTIVEIPEDLRVEFENNVDEALRDIAGVSTFTSGTQFMKANKVNEIIDYERTHPFMCPIMDDPMQWDSVRPYKINWNQLARRGPNGEWIPLQNPQAKRHVHFDPALTGDAFGVAIVHVAGTVPVKRFEDSEHEVVEQMPHYVVDFVLRIKGKPGHEVIFSNVRQLCYEFSYHGFHLAQFSTDTYQSREMVQSLRDQGYKAILYSVDTGIMSRSDNYEAIDAGVDGSGENKRKQAYRYLRRCIYDKRFSCYDYPVLWEELKGLEDGEVMIDHPENGSKDLADAVAGAVWTLYRSDYQLEPIAPQKGISEVSLGASDIDPETLDRRKGVEDNDGSYQDRTAEAPRKYFKKNRGPKTLNPSYKKVSVSGEETSITPGEGTSFVTRG